MMEFLKTTVSKLSPILAPEANRAHLVAQITLCTLAAISVGSLAWAGWRGAFPGLTRSTAGESLTAEAPASVGGTSASLPPNVLPVNALPMPATRYEPAKQPPATFPGSPLTSPPPSSVLATPSTLEPRMSTGLTALPPSNRPITNTQARENVDQARAVRGLGDMQGALEALRTADLREPQHPEILSEMALTYEAMHLADRAEAAWRSVLALGETAGGTYYGLAKSKLGGLQDTQKSLASTDARALSIGSCQILPDKTVTKGQRLTLRIPLISMPATTIDPMQVDLRVFFFDKLADGSIAPTHADPPNFTWISEPVDWRDNGEELVDVSYYMPELKPDELRNLGKRSYHGYIVKLFYQNRFMGEKAEPKALLDFKPQGAGPAGMDNPLFPKN